MELSFIRAIDTPYTLNKNEKGEEFVMNHFKCHLKNQGFDEVKVVFSLSEVDKTRGFSLIMPQKELTLGLEAALTSHLFLRIPRHIMSQQGEQKIPLVITSHSDRGKKTWAKELILLGPQK